MKLLIVTQTVDPRDSFLGAFHLWIEEISKNFESVEVIGLYVNNPDLPENVRVHSLGKENIKGSRLKKKLLYTYHFYKYTWRLRKSYDAVFVHMNQEYLLLAGLLWRLLGKKVAMWRNHYAGSFLTDIASWFTHKVFCTSRFSYTAKYRKTTLMPVGVSVSSCHPEESIDVVPRSILFLGRLQESKRPDVLIRALGLLYKKDVDFMARIVGGPSDPDSTYPKELEDLAESLGISEKVEFVGAVPNTETYLYYRSSEIYVNCSKSGMFDKSLFKASACGCLVLATSRDFQDVAGDIFGYEDGDVKHLAERLEFFLDMKNDRKKELQSCLVGCTKEHSLESLGKKIHQEIVSI